MLLNLVLLSFCLTVSTCLTKENIATVDPYDVLAPTGQEELSMDRFTSYTLDSYDEVFPLSRKLLEISGLGYDHVNDRLLAVNDEKAFIYFLNKNNGKIIEKIDFGKNGDFEGIEKVGNIIYITKSNGNICVYDMDLKAALKMIKTELTSANDVEGLGYDRKSNALIMACKGRSTLKGTIEFTKDKKSLYSFSIEENKLNPTPLFTIKDEELIQTLKVQLQTSDMSLKKKQKRLKRVKSFSPSAVAFHPHSGEIYVLSSVGRMLAVYSADYKVKYVIPLNKNLHTQPEGLCFDNEGTMYISNEGRGLVAKIYKYRFKRI